MRSKALRDRASERSCRNRTMPAIDNRIAAATINGPYMAAAPFRWGLCGGLVRNIAHAATGVNYARAESATRTCRSTCCVHDSSIVEVGVYCWLYGPSREYRRCDVMATVT